jgi:hypothetical protein
MDEDSQFINAADLKKDKRFIIWLNRHRDSKLSYAENLIFSTISRKSASQHELARITGLCRKKTIPNAIRKLIELGLCESRDGRYSAREPQDFANWITWDNPEAKRWLDNLFYFKIYRTDPASKLTARQNALFCKILNYPGKWPSYYATCLGMSSRSVYDQLVSLRSLGLIAKKGCYVPESIPDQWLSKPVVDSVIHPSVRKFLCGLQGSWLEPEVAIQKIEVASEALASHFGHTPSYLRRFWNETFIALYHPQRILAFVSESPKIAAHVITTGRTRKYLKTTTALVVKQLAAVPVEGAIYWNFEPDLLFRSL